MIKFIFYMLIKIKVFGKLILSFSMGFSNFWLVLPGMSKYPKWQFYNILKIKCYIILIFGICIDLLAILRVFKIINLQHLKNGMLNCHNFLHPDRPQEFWISTTIRWVRSMYVQVTYYSTSYTTALCYFSHILKCSCLVLSYSYAIQRSITILSHMQFSAHILYNTLP